MLFTIDWMEKKGEGWIVATLVEAVENGLTHKDVSINKVDKKSGEVAFPTFDALAPGHQINGNIWENNAGKKYLFPMREQKKSGGGGSAFRAQQIEKSQERKAEFVHQAQENKNLAVKVASTMRDATALAVASVNVDAFETIEEREEALRDSFARFKRWYIAQWTKTEQEADLPI